VQVEVKQRKKKLFYYKTFNLTTLEAFGSN
jgi:hypothetical protein